MFAQLVARVAALFICLGGHCQGICLFSLSSPPLYPLMCCVGISPMCHTLFSVDDTQNETEHCPLRSVTDHLSDVTAATDHACKLVSILRWGNMRVSLTIPVHSIWYYSYIWYMC